MTLSAEFAVLATEIQRLTETWRALEISVVEDRPAGEGLAAADHLVEVVTDGAGELQAAWDATRGPSGAESLHTTATALLSLRRRFDDECRSYLAVTALLRAIQGREAEWRGWVKGVRRGVDRCAEALGKAEDTMVRCWREAVELAELDGCGASR